MTIMLLAFGGIVVAFLILILCGLFFNALERARREMR